jgi:hypothetical protein
MACGSLTAPGLLGPAPRGVDVPRSVTIWLVTLGAVFALALISGARAAARSLPPLEGVTIIGTYGDVTPNQSVWQLFAVMTAQQSKGKCTGASQGNYLTWVRQVNETTLTKGGPIALTYPKCTVPSFSVGYDPFKPGFVNQTMNQLYLMGHDYTCGARSFSSYQQLVQALNGGASQLASLNKGRIHSTRVLYPWCAEGIPDPSLKLTVPVSNASGGSPPASASGGRTCIGAEPNQPCQGLSGPE